MDSRAWYVFADKVLGAMAADREGLFADLRPEIERRLFEADPDKDLRNELSRTQPLPEPADLEDVGEGQDEHDSGIE